MRIEQQRQRQNAERSRRLAWPCSGSGRSRQPHAITRARAVVMGLTLADPELVGDVAPGATCFPQRDDLIHLTVGQPGAVMVLADHVPAGIDQDRFDHGLAGAATPTLTTGLCCATMVGSGLLPLAFGLSEGLGRIRGDLDYKASFS